MSEKKEKKEILNKNAIAQYKLMRMGNKETHYASIGNTAMKKTLENEKNVAIVVSFSIEIIANGFLCFLKECREKNGFEIHGLQK